MKLDILKALENRLSDEQIEDIKNHVNDYYGGNYETYIAGLIVMDYYSRIEREEEPKEED